MDNLQLDDIALFAAVADAGSFIAAARRLNQPKSTVSRRLQVLEARLGVRLIERTTRRLTLTAAGRGFLERVGQPLVALRDAADEAKGRQQEPQGHIRMSTGVGMATHVFANVLAEFLATYPKVVLELDLTDSRVDIVAQGFDLAIRAGEMQDSSLVQRKLGFSRTVMVCTPDFLLRHGPIERPEALSRVPGALQPWRETWELTGPDGRIEVPMRGPVRVNNIIMLAQAAKAGLGVALLPTFICHRDLKAGSLVRLLPEWEPKGYPVYAVLPSRRHPSTAVRALLDLLDRHMPTFFAD